MAMSRVLLIKRALNMQQGMEIPGSILFIPCFVLGKCLATP